MRFLGEVASFGSPRAIIVNFSTILVGLAAIPTDRLYLVPARSVWENIFHFRPYSSGMMRALSRLLHGDPSGAWEFNPLAFPALAVMVVLLGKNAWTWYHQAQRTPPGPAAPLPLKSGP